MPVKLDTLWVMGRWSQALAALYLQVSSTGNVKRAFSCAWADLAMAPSAGKLPLTHAIHLLQDFCRVFSVTPDQYGPLALCSTSDKYSRRDTEDERWHSRRLQRLCLPVQGSHELLRAAGTLFRDV